MATSAVDVAPAGPWFSRRTLAATGRRYARGHAPPLGLLLLTTLWITRGFLLSRQLPAGTDMLGFVSRSAQNATVGNALSLWTPTSLGYPRTWSLDNVLGAVTMITGDPVLTVKLLDIVVMFGTGGAMYLLAWSWYRSRTIGVVAGLLYMLSQAALSRWGSGQLNVAMAVAIAPVLIWSWSLCLRRFTVRRALGLALLVTSILLVRLDMLLYVAPFMLLYLLFAVPYAARARPFRNAVLTLAVAVPAALILNVYQILPVALGYGPKWLSSGQLFDLQQISTHTLSAYQSLLGFGREIGYLAFTGQQTWYSFPFLPLWGYYAAASLVVVCAFLALAWHHGRRTIFLAAAAIVAVFLAKGSDPPFGDLYTWAINHIPVVADIRDPNRWLIFEALALGPLAGITIDRLIKRGPAALARVRIPRRIGTATARAVAVCAVAAMLVQVAPTIASGLKTWEPPASDLQLLQAARTSAAGVVATIPYDQSTMFVDTSAYSGYEHDLGYESALFTGQPSLGTGDWDQRTSDFVSYTSRLLASGDAAFVKLLGSVGVTQLLSLNEPIQAAQLVNAARGSYYQQAEAQSMTGLVSTASTSGGTLYTLMASDPQISFRQNIAVVLGGRDSLAAFADLPSVNPSQWAVFDADDLLAAGGLPRLLSIMSQSTLIVAGGAQPSEIAALAAPAITKLSGITSDPQLGRQTLLLPSDQSTFTGALADTTQGIPLPGTSRASSSFTLTSKQTVEIWAHIESSPDAAAVSVAVDGRRIYDHAPLAVGSDTFTWVRAGVVTLPAGSHEVTVAAQRSEFGSTYEVDETRVVDSATRAADQSDLETALTAGANHIAYSIDLDSAGPYASTPAAFSPVTSVPGLPIRFWTPTAGVTTSPDVTDTGAPAADVEVPGDRVTYTAVQHSFATAQDWSHRPEVFVGFDGTNSGLTYQVVVTFDNGVGEAFYNVKDDASGWRTVALSTDGPAQSDNVDWARVTGIRIALPSKASSSTFRVGGVSLSGQLTAIPVSYPAPYASSTTRPQLMSAQAGVTCDSNQQGSTAPTLSNGSLDASLPATLLGDGCRAIVLPTTGINALPVVIPKTGSGSTDQAAFTSSHPGVLVFDQGYDAGWTLSTGGSTYRSLPVQSVVNGYLLPAGRHAITLSYSGNQVGVLGLWISVAALLFVCGLMWRFRSAGGPTEKTVRRPISRSVRALLVVAAVVLVLLAVAVGFEASGASRLQFACAVISAGPALFLLQGRWWLPWAAALVVIAACPVVDLVGGGAALDGLATFAVVLLALAITRLAFDSIPRAAEGIQRTT